MKTRWSAWLIVGMMLALALPAVAHHSFSAEFDLEKPVTVKGTLTKIDWRNPHCWIHIDVKNPDGTVVSWAFETGGPAALMRQGWRRSDLPVGVEVTISGFAAKPGVFTKPSGTTRSITFADGKQLFDGAAPGTPEK
jgi:hypothetical protein